jgi:hypothetical protein
MMYNSQNYRVFGLCPSSGILKARKQRFGNWISGEGETPTLYGPLEKANLNHWATPVRFTTTIHLPETRLIQREVTGKYAMKIVLKHAHSWT